MTRDTDRYLRRATRGLWGKRRHEAVLELRAAIEDKIYRATLLGLDQHEAERRALRDLGDPHHIARELSKVHTLPRGVQATLAFTLIGVLSIAPLQSAAQVVGTNFSTTQDTCDFSPTAVKALPASIRATLDPAIATHGRTTLETWCKAKRDTNADALDYASLLKVLADAGVRILDTRPTNQTTPVAHREPGEKWLLFPDSPNAARLVMPNKTNDGRPYVTKERFIKELLRSTSLPVTLTGDRNPRLSIGSTSFVLGTDRAPMLATDFYTGALMLRFGNQFDRTTSRGGTMVVEQGLLSLPDPRTSAAMKDKSLPTSPVTYTIALPEGTLGAGLVRDAVSPDQARIFTTRVENGRLLLPSGTQYNTTRFVTSIEDLRSNFTAGTERKVLLLKLSSTNDLHQLETTVIPAALVHSSR